MKPSEIVAIDAKRNKENTSFEDNVNALKAMIAAGAQVLKEGDTLFAFLSHKERSVEIHSFNAAPTNIFIENIKKFLELLKKLGAKEAWTEFDNPKLGNVLKQLEPDFKVKFTKNKRYMAKVSLS